MLTEKWGTNSGSVRLPGIKYWHGVRIVAYTVCPLCCAVQKIVYL